MCYMQLLQWIIQWFICMVPTIIIMTQLLINEHSFLEVCQNSLWSGHDAMADQRISLETELAKRTAATSGVLL